MGYAKNRAMEEDRERRWHATAEINGYRGTQRLCTRCAKLDHKTLLLRLAPLER
ncbi:MAG: hypothetical protein ACRELF_24650 [Gemmataceae bacterium]